jgi:hypothetical protein
MIVNSNYVQIVHQLKAILTDFFSKINLPKFAFKQ